MTKNKLIFWACDYSEKTGEGNLARKFIKENYQKRIIKINTLKVNFFFSHKYIVPFIGILSCWRNYFKGYHVGFINYLPLWNFLIFILLPPKTILGPITGGALYNETNKINYFIRKILFPLFYRFSEIIINLRFKDKLIFSTELLKKYLLKKTTKRCEFNFVLKNLKFKKKKKYKDIDFLIYHRIHNNKLSLFNYEFIRRLTEKNLKIFVVGDKLNIKKVVNLGYINKKKLDFFQSKSKYSLCSGENIYSFFVVECITNHVKIIIDKDKMKKVKILKKFFISMNKLKINLKKTN